jgi:transaldolase
MKSLTELKVKIFADGADKATMLDMHQKEFIQGLTTNPTLMRASGIKNYKSFCKEILAIIKNKPLSFEVFSDDFLEMERQAMEIASWGSNVYVKIPITNTKKESCSHLIERLSKRSVKVNVTALMTINQVYETINHLDKTTPSYISVFAGRIADTGRNPIPILTSSLKLMKDNPLSELIWASPRELLNIFQADEIGCHIITVTNEILKKLNVVGYSLEEYSLDTVKMFYNDAIVAGYKL